MHTYFVFLIQQKFIRIQIYFVFLKLVCWATCKKKNWNYLHSENTQRILWHDTNVYKTKDGNEMQKKRQRRRRQLQRRRWSASRMRERARRGQRANTNDDDERKRARARKENKLKNNDTQWTKREISHEQTDTNVFDARACNIIGDYKCATVVVAVFVGVFAVAAAVYVFYFTFNSFQYICINTCECIYMPFHCMCFVLVLVFFSLSQFFIVRSCVRQRRSMHAVVAVPLLFICISAYSYSIYWMQCALRDSVCIPYTYVCVCACVFWNENNEVLSRIAYRDVHALHVWRICLLLWFVECVYLAYVFDFVRHR